MKLFQKALDEQRLMLVSKKDYTTYATVCSKKAPHTPLPEQTSDKEAQSLRRMANELSERIFYTRYLVLGNLSNKFNPFEQEITIFEKIEYWRLLTQFGTKSSTPNEHSKFETCIAYGQ